MILGESVERMGKGTVSFEKRKKNGKMDVWKKRE